jgi:GH24 family phage-related lysozyme (muramidase)
VDYDQLKKDIIEDEGYVRTPYPDTKGILTGGVGHNLVAHHADPSDIATWKANGIPDVVIDKWYQDDVFDAIEVVKAIFGDVEALPDPVARALVDMAFDVMWELRDWHHLKAAVSSADWQGAADSIMNSQWAHEGKGGYNRCRRNADRMLQALDSPAAA